MGGPDPSCGVPLCCSLFTYSTCCAFVRSEIGSKVVCMAICMRPTPAYIGTSFVRLQPLFGQVTRRKVDATAATCMCNPFPSLRTSSGEMPSELIASTYITPNQFLGKFGDTAVLREMTCATGC